MDQQNSPEKKLMNDLAKAEKAYQDAKRNLAEAKKRCTNAESIAVSTKIHKENIEEQLREFVSQKVIEGIQYSLFDEE
jgi:regulatory protein YycI of two-component signal transduction system YycFG